MIESKRTFAIEAVLTALCALAGVWLGTAYTRMPDVISTAAYYQSSMAPSVLFACGRGFTNLARAPEQEAELGPLLAFLEQRTDRFDCGQLPPVITEVPFSALQSASRYLLLGIGTAWKITGVSWRGLAWVYGLIYGTVGALAYAVARRVLGRASSLIVVAVFVTSAAQLGELPHFRDYLKVPFFLALFAILLHVVMRPMSTRRLVLWSAAAGAVTGIGFGIRFDMVAFLAFFLGALLVFLPGSLWHQWRWRLLAGAAAVTAFLVMTFPILRAFQLGNNSSHVVILGFADQHESAWGLRRMYQIGTVYYDGYVAAAVNSYWQRQTGSDRLHLLDSPEYGRAGADYLRAIAWMFPADLLARAWACVPALARHSVEPVLLPHALPEGSLAGSLLDLRMSIMSWLTRVLPWLSLMPLVASIGLAAFNVRLSLLAVSAWLFLAAVSSLQFQARHIVHLELVSLLLIGVALDWVVRRAWRVAVGRQTESAPVGRQSLWAAARRVAAVTAALALLLVVPLAVLRAVQAPKVRALYHSYSAGLSEARTFSATPIADNRVLVTLPATLAAGSSSLRTRFVAADFGGSGCGFYLVTATIRYDTARADNDFSRPLTVPVPEAPGETARAWFASYDFDDPAGIDSHRFAGLELPVAQLPCLVAIAQVDTVEALPLLVDAVLPPRWEDGKLYAIFQRWETDAVNPVPRVNYAIPDGLPVRSRVGARTLAPIRSAIDYQDRIVTMEDDHRIVVSGSTSPLGYLVAWVAAPAARSALLVAEGELVAGGLTIGLERDRAWAEQVQVTTPGRFRVVIEISQDGEYRPVIANLSGQSRSTRFQIDRIGWVQ